MPLNVYLATCPKCGFVHQTQSRNYPPGQHCNRPTPSSDKCDGVLAWAKLAPDALTSHDIDAMQKVLTEADSNNDRMRDAMRDTPSELDLVIDYTNYLGERRIRTICPTGRPLFYGTSQYHPEYCWLLEAYDTEKDDIRTFDMSKIHHIARAGEPLHADHADHDKVYDKVLNERDREIAARNERIRYLKGELDKLKAECDLECDQLRAEKHADREEIETLQTALSSTNDALALVTQHVERQDRLLQQSATLLEAAAAMAHVAQDDAGASNEVVLALEAELEKARRRRAFDATRIHSLSEDYARLKQVHEKVRADDTRANIGLVKTEIDALTALLLGKLGDTTYSQFLGGKQALLWALNPDQHKPVSHYK